jgi:aminomethyltransferase
MKKTALNQDHIDLGGRMVEFGGWHMPVQYTGLGDEHNACRNAIGLFDVSHMGEVVVRGKGSLEFLNGLVTNDLRRIVDGQAQYSVMCQPDGGCVDDLIIHRRGPEDYFICVNASNSDKDFAWIKERAPKGVSVEDESPRWSQIAIQGRHAAAVVARLTDVNVQAIKYYWFTEGHVLGKEALIARTGYTGEDGFELYVPWSHGPAVWRACLAEGKSFGIKPCGLGARDTLRTEMKFPLYGHEISETLNPLEAGLGWVTKLDKGDFVGRTPLASLKERGYGRALVGLKTLGRGIPRQDYLVEREGKVIGKVTSGTHSPSLNHGIAIAYVDVPSAALGTKLDVVIRDQRVPHEVVPTPFYKRPY